MKNFKELALRTESNDFSKIHERFNNPVFQTMLLKTMERAHVQLDQLDELKKHLFYGRNCDRVKYGESKFKPLLEHTDTDLRLLHAVIGIATESSELIEAYFKFLFKEDQDGWDYTNLIEEYADCLWYGQILNDVNGVDDDEVKERVINKLKVRYPEKFSEVDAVDRDLDSERVELEDQTELQKAMKVLVRNVKNDYGYRESWKANIAVCMQDAYSTDKTVHEISNEGADNFLNNLTRDV